MTCTNGRCVSDGCPVTEPIQFVRYINDSEFGSFAARSVPFPIQNRGNLAVVAIGWNTSAGSISSVADSAGNTYRLAAAKLASASLVSQAMYYAYDLIPDPDNRLSVTFDASVKDPDVRIAEYSGFGTTDPLDGVAAMTGSTNLSSSGTIQTSDAGLLVGANTVHTFTTAPGAGLTSRGVNAFGNILEDQVTMAPGSYSASAVLSGAGEWVMQAAAFRGR